MALSDYSFTPDEEVQIVRKQFKTIHELFQKQAFADRDIPVMCKIHDVFKTEKEQDHNCLGCNFADSTHLIANFLQTFDSQTQIQFAYTTYIILCYLLVERMDTLLSIIDLNNAYRAEHFKVLSEIRRWANFFKHPKAFILTHHPVFTFDKSPKNTELFNRCKVKIDRSFLDKYFTEEHEKKEKQLYEELENKDDVLVVLPNAVDLTLRLCAAISEFVGIITENRVYREVIRKRSTFFDYWAAPLEPPTTAS